MALKALKDHIDPGGDRWDPVQRRVWYAIFLFTFSPTHVLVQMHGTLAASCSGPCPITHNPYADRADAQGQKG